VTLCMQDASQLRLAYGRPFADVVLNTCGNIISGQVTGETAKLLSDRFGRTMQDRESFTINSSDTNTTQSAQLEPVLPVSRISSLSSGEFVGMVADLADQPIELKTFCCRISMDTEAIKTEEAAYKPLPFVREVTEEELERNFIAVKADARRIIRDELERIRNRPDLRHLIIM
jgi:hypothetical protein